MEIAEAFHRNKYTSSCFIRFSTGIRACVGSAFVGRTPASAAGPSGPAGLSYDEVREKSDSSPESDVFRFNGSDDPANRSTSPITLLPKFVVDASGLPSINDFWMAS